MSAPVTEAEVGAGTGPVSADRHVRGLDALRALGALMVVTTHVGFHSGDGVYGPFAGILARMDMGVAIFFVLSGFLLFRPHVIAWFDGLPRPATRTYLKHRAWRILPALWLAVGAAALLPDTATTGGDLLAHAALAQIYLPSPPQTAGLTQMWSLATEVAFYLLLPAAAALLLGRRRASRRRLRVILAVLVATPVLGALWMAAFTGERAGVWLPGYIGWFGLGLALAVWSAARARGQLSATWLDDVGRQPLSVWGLAAALYLLLSTPVAGPYDLSSSTSGAAAFKNVAYALCAALVLLPAVTPTRRVQGPVAVLESRPLRFLGDISYGVFCYHLVVLAVVERALGVTIFAASFWQLWIPTLALTVVVAAASYRWVERPLARRARRAERRPAPGATAAPTASTTSS